MKIKICYSVLIGFAAERFGRAPTARELQQFCREHKDLVSEEPSLEGCQYALDHPNECAPIAGDEG